MEPISSKASITPGHARGNSASSSSAVKLSWWRSTRYLVWGGSKTFVLPGEYVRPGQRIALIHDPEKIWVEANIRETEIRRLRVGQRVDITADAYPNESIVGEVARLGQATTGEFALLPAPNPSGNFTKVTQRLPVRITLAENAHLLKPGMLVEVDIHVDESGQEHTP